MSGFKSVAGIVLLGASLAAQAADGVVGPVNIDVVSLYVARASPREAGTVTITVRNGFTLPAGVHCDPQYVSTSRASDPDRSLFAIVDQAWNYGQTVNLIITDDPAFNAYPGRCSLKGIELVSRFWIG